MTLPIQLGHSPISEAAVEIRFDTTLPSDAVFGMTYGTLKEDYPTVEKLPILQLPEALREGEPNLQFQPQYRLRRGNFLVQIGPRTLSIVAIDRYPGWTAFRGEIVSVFNRVRDLGIIARVTRFGLRYIDFFDLNIFEKIGVQVLVRNEDKAQQKLIARVEQPNGNYFTTLMVSNDATKDVPSGPRKGSVLDLDTFLPDGADDFFDRMTNILDDAHDIEKNLFFALLRPDFLDELKPTY